MSISSDYDHSSEFLNIKNMLNRVIKRYFFNFIFEYFELRIIFSSLIQMEAKRLIKAQIQLC